MPKPHRPSRSHYATVWIAILSILLTVVAPVVSQSLAASQMARPAVSVAGAAPAQNNAHAGRLEQHAGHGGHDHASFAADDHDPAYSQDTNHGQSGYRSGHGHEHHNSGNKNQPAHVHEACGYCNFFAHTPAIPDGARAEQFANGGPSQTKVLASANILPPAPAFLRRQTRAPPHRSTA